MLGSTIMKGPVLRHHPNPSSSRPFVLTHAEPPKELQPSSSVPPLDPVEMVRYGGRLPSRRRFIGGVIFGSSIALGGNLFGVTSGLLSLDDGKFAASTGLDILVPVNGFRRARDVENGCKPPPRTINLLLKFCTILQFADNQVLVSHRIVRQQTSSSTRPSGSQISGCISSMPWISSGGQPSTRPRCGGRPGDSAARHCPPQRSDLRERQARRFKFYFISSFIISNRDRFAEIG